MVGGGNLFVTQNIYDDPNFFSEYGRIPRSIAGLDGAPEWPSLRAMLPPLHGAFVLDLGCGYGWFSRWARSAGAAAVDGIDVSERMLNRARATTSDPAVRYIRADLETAELGTARYDLVYSSLALHYVAGLQDLVGRVRRALVPGGSFVFSVEHPIYTAPTVPGWMTSDEGRRVWPIDLYLVEGPRVTDWLVKGVLKHHRTIGTMVSLLLAQGLTLRALEEWCPTDAQVAQQPTLAEERHRPMFLLVSCQG